jgi:hypothetical protein
MALTVNSSFALEQEALLQIRWLLDAPNETWVLAIEVTPNSADRLAPGDAVFLEATMRKSRWVRTG